MASRWEASRVLVIPDLGRRILLRQTFGTPNGGQYIYLGQTLFGYGGTGRGKTRNPEVARLGDHITSEGELFLLAAEVIVSRVILPLCDYILLLVIPRLNKAIRIYPEICFMLGRPLFRECLSRKKGKGVDYSLCIALFLGPGILIG